MAASLTFFVDTDGYDWQSKHSNGILATVISMVHYGKSRLYTLVMVVMVIYHTSYPAGPRHDKSHSYLYLGV